MTDGLRDAGSKGRVHCADPGGRNGTVLGVKMLNTAAYHPQCDGLVETYNRTLKTALRKHAARFGT